MNGTPRFGRESEPADDEGGYDLAPETPPRALPKANAPATASALLHTTPPGRPGTLDYRDRKADAPPDPETLKNLYAPLWLLGGGVAVEVAGAFWRGRDAEAALTDVGLTLLLGTGVMLAGVWLAARLRGIDLGPLPVAAMKLAAVFVASSAAVTLADPLLGLVPLGGLLSAALGFALCFALLGALFDLEGEDVWYCVCVIFLVGLAVHFASLGVTQAWS